MNNTIIKKSVEESLASLRSINPEDAFTEPVQARENRLRKVLVANRGEIAKRFFLALHEEGIPSVAIVTSVDEGQSWYDFADEVMMIGEPGNYSRIPVVIAAVILSGANAIYPGYGFLSESAEFTEALHRASKLFDREIIFMGPRLEVMQRLENKIKARELAHEEDIPLLKGSRVFYGIEEAEEEAETIGYPVMVKLNAAGGGRGIRYAENREELGEAVLYSQRTGRSHYNDDAFYIEKYIEHAIHMEVQLFNGKAVGIRKCAVQRHNQKIIEESGQNFVDREILLAMVDDAERMARRSGYDCECGAGTMEFLMDPASETYGFLEFNTRLQVEYSVTEQSMGFDIVKWQIMNFDGRADSISYPNIRDPEIFHANHSIECRVFAEEPEKGYRPSPGEIKELILPTFHGVRCDFGFMEGDHIPSDYDSMIGKLIVTGSNRSEAHIRLERALQEIYIQGVSTNLRQLLRIVRHPDFIRGDYSNRLIPENPELQFREEIPSDRDSEREVLLLGTLTEYIRIYQRIAREFKIRGNLDTSLSNRSLTTLPARFTTLLGGEEHRIEIFQVALSSFHLYHNGTYSGQIRLSHISPRSGNYLFQFGSRSYRIKAEKRGDNLQIHMKGRSGKINYHTLQVVAEGTGEGIDPEGIVRAPFQCSFVSLAERGGEPLHKGDSVIKGEPIMIVSSMKMETTLYSPVSGVLDYIVDDGEYDNLVLQVNSEGAVTGKGFEESEILFVIEPTETEEVADEKREKETPSVQDNHLSLDDIFDPERARELYRRDPEKYILTLVYACRSVFLGFIQQDEKISRLPAVFTALEELDLEHSIDEEGLQKINDVINLYRSVKLLFSPLIVEGVSYLEELNYFISNIHDFSYSPPESFIKLIDTLSRFYRIERARLTSKGEEWYLETMLFHLQRAYFMCTDLTDVVTHLIRFVLRSRHRPPETYQILCDLLATEQYELDDTLARHIQEFLDRDYPRRSEHHILTSGSLESTTSTIHDTDKLESGKEARANILCSLESSSKERIPTGIPELSQSLLIDRLDYLEKRTPLRPLSSPYKDIYLYALFNNNGKEPCEYVAFIFTEYPARGIDAPYREKLSDLSRRGLLALETCRQARPVEVSRLEIVMRGVPRDILTRSISLALYRDLRTVFTQAYRSSPNAECTTLLLSAEHGGRNLSWSHLFGAIEKRFYFDIISSDDPRYPYSDTPEERDRHIFVQDKWRVEDWASYCCDEGQWEELHIPGVDDNMPEGSDEPLQVAGRILRGKVMGKKVLFYFKDSRIRAGATGNLEGLKYIAALYLARREKIPVYVWNDGSGANINEGIVSLNRGGQGFMMNTLMRSSLDDEHFTRYVINNPDPAMQNVIKGIEPLIQSSSEQNFPFVVSVGIGSSAGLDVYGASQAAVQVLLDSPQAYRVLTGAGVVRSVLGKEFTNYEIGGARVMGQWTGIVDFVARNRLYLIEKIRTIHALLSDDLPGNEYHPCQRPVPAGSDLNRRKVVFTESQIIPNVDAGLFLPFKQEYHAGRVLIGGFARLGGKRVLIMGPRSSRGLRSFNALTRAREMLISAEKMGAFPILFFGKRFFQDADYFDSGGIRVRMEFLETWRRIPGCRAVIITDPEGIHGVEVSSSADVTVCLQRDEKDSPLHELSSKNSTIIANDEGEAFRTLCQIFEKTARHEIDFNPDDAPRDIPVIPDDPSEPFEIIESVIERIVDQNSFVELYHDMNDPISGPTLVTGLARFQGKSVGIIADQPLILGGGADAPGTEKFRIFTRFCNRNRLPILMLSNSSGFVPGIKQERLRIQAIGADSLDENILGNVPVVSVVLRQNYGGRQIHAFNRFLRPGIAYLALKDATLAVMGTEVAFDLLKGKTYRQKERDEGRDRAEAFRASYIREYNEKGRAQNDALATGCVDRIIDSPESLRDEIISALELARERAHQAFNAPLDS